MPLAIRSLTEADLDAAEQLRRLAFGTLFGLPDPLSFRGDTALLRPRLGAFPDGGLVAEVSGELVGVAMANHWGSLGVFGPVAVRPDQWRKGIARKLLDATMPVFDRWGSRMVGLFTFPERPAHVRLYQSAGFWPRYLTAIMERPVTATPPGPEAASLAAAASADRVALIRQCAALTGSIWDGLDLTGEINMVLSQGLGDVLVLPEASQVVGFAICHTGRGSEGGSGEVYVKFAAVRAGTDAPARFTRLVAACAEFAHRRGVRLLAAGVNLGRMNAYRLMIELGFRAVRQGVAMHRPWIEAYDRPEVFALDDWR
jgi:GNAT superfamily N-acetyltransferase